MNEYLLLGILLVLVIFTVGVKLNRNPGSLGSFGYKSSRSTKNEDTWYEANTYAGRAMMMKATFLLLLLALSEMYFPNLKMQIIMVVCYLLSGLILLIVYTEKHLRATFFRDGKRKPTAL